MRHRKTLEYYINQYKKDIENINNIIDYASYERGLDDSTTRYYLNQLTEYTDVFYYLKELKEYKESED